MSAELKEGVKLNRITTRVTESGQSGLLVRNDADRFCSVAMGSGSYLACKEIVVSEQTGQMDMVPWARCVAGDGSIVLVNLSQVFEVELAQESEGEGDPCKEQ